MKIAGAAAFVTGGAQGIGKAICEALAKKGAKVCVADINGDKGVSIAKQLLTEYPGCAAMFVRCDVSSPDSFKNAFEKARQTFGYVDILVNNAGILEEDDWSAAVDTNLKGVMAGTSLALDKMGKDKGGRGGVVINHSSLLGLFPAPFFPTYSATKAAIAFYTAAWANEAHFANHGVRLNVICPAVAKTAMITNAVDRCRLKQKLQDFMQTQQPIQIANIVDVAIEIVENDGNAGKLVEVGPEGAKYRRAQEIKI